MVSSKTKHVRAGPLQSHEAASLYAHFGVEHVVNIYIYI